MELKKSKQANLENKAWIFRLLGLTAISSLVLMAFTYSLVEVEKEVKLEEKNQMEDELVFDIEVPEEEPEPEPEQAPPPPPVIEDINVADDEDDVDDVDLGMDVEVEDPPEEEPEPVVIEEEPIAEFAEVEPSFPGGEAEMMLWIQKNIKYPQMAIEMEQQGTVYVQFVVNKDGSIEKVKILRGEFDQLNKEAERVVKMMPPWMPGEQAGKKVRVRFTLPIKFRLG